jgi:hypothetical protein
MRKFGLVIILGAAALGACREGTVTSTNDTITVNTTAIGEDIQNGLEGAGNMARNGARVVGNELGRAGEVIGNEAKAAWNELKATAREVGGEGNASGNSAGR